MRRLAGHWTVARRAVWATAAAAVTALSLLTQLEAARAESDRVGAGAMPRGLIPPPMLVGDWLAVIKTDGRPQPVRLAIHTIEPGKTAGKLIYSSPKRCTVDLEYGGPDRDRHVFYIVPFTNCFRYKSTDTVVLMSAQDLPGTFSDLSRAAPAYGLMPKDQNANSGTAVSDAGVSPAAKPVVDRMQYSISVGDQTIETGLLARQ